MSLDDMLARGGVVLVSACLAGEACRYNGEATPHPLVMGLLERGLALPVCPEMLGGLGAPREPVELRGGRAFCPSGREVTAEFRAGVAESLRLAREQGCGDAILKARSPSCGHGRVYDGTFSGVLVPGSGMLAQALAEAGFLIVSETELP